MAATGALMNAVFVNGGAGVQFGGGIAFGPDGNIYVGYDYPGAGPGVSKYNGTTGAFMGEYITDYSITNSTTVHPTAIAFGPDGNLYMASTASSEIYCFYGPSSSSAGALLRDFAVSPSANTGVANTGGMVFGPNGNLYVACFDSSSNEGSVEEYTTGGQAVTAFVAPGSGGLKQGAGLAFDPDSGNLYVVNNTYASTNKTSVNEYSTTGQFLSEIVPQDANGAYYFYGIAFRNLPPVANPQTLMEAPNLPVNVNLATLASDYETSLGNLTFAAGTGSYAATNGSITVSGDTATITPSSTGGAMTAYYSVTDQADGGAANTVYAKITATFPISTLTFAAGSGTGVYGRTTSAMVHVTYNGTPVVAGLVTFEMGGNYLGQESTDGYGDATLSGISLAAYHAGTFANALTASYSNIWTPGDADCSASTSVVVTPAPLTITADNKTKMYGVGLPTLTASYAGLVNGDTSASLIKTPALTTTATASSHVSGNPYGITVGGAVDPDYTINYVPGTLTVTTAPLTITAVNKTKVYGAALPTLTLTYAGFVNGDTAANLAVQPTLSTTATASVHVAGNPYSITASGAVDPDYAFNYVAAQLTVTPAPLTITAVNKTKAYGAALPTLTASYSGFVNGDTAASLTTLPTLSTTATASSHVAGSPYSITASGATDPDYTISYVAGQLTVTPVALTITADSKTKVYGAALPGLTASYAGFVNGDTPANLTTQPTLSTTATAASHVSGSPYSITVRGAADTDYTISYVAGTLAVTPAALTITADNKNKLYGAALPTLTASYAGFVNGDTSSSLTKKPALVTTATKASHVVGNPYSITATGAVDSDYAITYVAGRLTVTPAALIITANNATKVYGAALPTFTASYHGFVNGDTAASLTTAPTLTTTATAASHVAGSPYTITPSAAVDPDYTFHYVAGQLAVTAAPLTVTAVNKTKVYGAALPTLTASYRGFVNGDTAANLTTPPTLTTTATAASHVSGSPYSITPSAAVDPDYTFTYVAGTLAVTPAPLAITADNETMLMGLPVPPLRATYTGLVNGDTPASLTHAPVLSTTATRHSPVGTYSISVSGAASSDYTITQYGGTMSVINILGTAVLLPDPLAYGKTMLSVVGTSGNDVIQINPAATAGYVTVVFDGQSLGSFDPTSRICVHGVSGNDTISVSPSVTLPAWLYADAGDVQLQGGGGPTLLVGGPGKDTLWGGTGPTIMIGGSGATSMLGGSGDAILVGGTTAYDANDTALKALLAIWSSGDTYTDRVAAITSDVNYPLNATTVYNNQAVDSLFGGSGMDLFFSSPSDNLTNTRPGEAVIAVD